MAEILKGVSPDAEIITNSQGGKQSKTAYGFHLIDADAILSLAEVLQYGASRYERDNWRKIPSEEHFNHMMIHYYAWLKGDTTDDHLGHFFCRAMMLYAVGKAEEAKYKPVEPWGEEDEARQHRLFCDVCKGCYVDCVFKEKANANELGSCEHWCQANPAEARKIMDEMEVKHGNDKQ